jgi:hypothetical protein
MENIFEKFKKFTKHNLDKNTTIDEIIEFNSKIIDTSKIDPHGFTQNYFYNEFIQQFKNVNHSKIEFVDLNNLSTILSKYYSVVTNLNIKIKEPSLKNDVFLLKDAKYIDFENNQYFKSKVDNLYSKDIKFMEKITH